MSGPSCRSSISTSLLLVLCLGIFALPSVAQADTPITSFSALPSNTQAGGHPDIETKFTLEGRLSQGSQSLCDCEDVKNATVHLPAGVIGNPHATPQCTIADFSADQCPIDSQIGIAEVNPHLGGPFSSAIYNLVPPPNVAGLLAFKLFAFNTPQFTVLSARTGGDYGLDATSTSVVHSGSISVESFTQVLWGVPASPIHNQLRINPALLPIEPGTTAIPTELCDASGSQSTSDPSTVVKFCRNGPPPSESNSPLTPFNQNPTTCASASSSSLEVLSYDGGVTHADSTWPQETGCDQLSFNPSLYAQPTTTETDTSSGIDVDLSVPQPLSSGTPSPTELRGATVTLPPGFSINPNAADGKTACTDEEAQLGAFASLEESQCPDFAKVGSLEVDSSALPGPLPGYIYLGQPLAGNPYRVVLTANGFATHIKLAGEVTADPLTGQLVITFAELPQSPLTAIDMHFFGSERGLLATPTQCGTYPVTTTFTPWDETIGTQTSTQFFTLDSGPNGTSCPGARRPFNPSFEAMSASNTAGSHSPFSVELRRSDGDQDLAGLTVTTPPGFSATLAGIPYCSDASIAAAAALGHSGRDEEADPSCPAASQIGTALSGAGAGDHPVYVSGKVFLAGPYKGAPLSLVVITPTISGPYDLGNVIVRAALRVNPETAQVTADSDPLPQIVQGIPLRLRTIRINLDRRHFALNPTNCDPLSVTAQIGGDQGAQANLTSLFQVANCAALPFAPKLSLKLSGGVNRLGHPAIHAVLRTQPGEANPSSITVTLPAGEQLDQAHIVSVCSKVQFAADSCPAGSLLGHAKVTTPLLGQPLSGPVYLRSSGKGIPDLALDLSGQINVVAVAHVSSVNARYRTTFETVPDVPLGTVTLDLLGGRKGLLQNESGLCGTHKQASVAMGGQNGADADSQVPLQVACGTKHGSGERRHAADHIRRSRP